VEEDASLALKRHSALTPVCRATGGTKAQLLRRGAGAVGCLSFGTLVTNRPKIASLNRFLLGRWRKRVGVEPYPLERNDKH
jgi:hypothetical protein